MNTRLLTKRELADYFAVSTRTIDAWCASRFIPFVRVGARKRFRLEDIERYLASRSFGHPVSDQPRTM